MMSTSLQECHRLLAPETDHPWWSSRWMTKCICKLQVVHRRIGVHPSESEEALVDDSPRQDPKAQEGTTEPCHRHR